MLEQVNLFEKKTKSDLRCCQKNYERLMIVTDEIYYLLLIHCHSGHYYAIYGKANKLVTSYTMTNENQSEDVQNRLTQIKMLTLQLR